jgi:hypothetical protein
MNIRTKIAAIVCALLVPAGLAVAMNGSADASSAKHHGWPSSTKMSSTQIAKQAHAKDGTHVFTVIEHEVRTADVDTGDAGESPGDYFLFESRLLHPHTGDVVGVDSGKCMIAIRTFVCDATARINGKGKIVVAGAFFSENDGVLPITGGTGAYREAAGQLFVRGLPNGDTRLTFVLVD